MIPVNGEAVGKKYFVEIKQGLWYFKYQIEIKGFHLDGDPIRCDVSIYGDRGSDRRWQDEPDKAFGQ